MRRRELLAAVAGAALVRVGAAAGKVYRIGILTLDVPPPDLLDSFEAGLRELGYVAGKDVVLVIRHAGGETERLPALAESLVSPPVDAILTVNTTPALAAKQATRTIPIVMMRVADPVKTGLVASLAHPGGNVTGLSAQSDEVGAKRLQLLQEILPGLTHVAALWYGGNPGSATNVRALELAVRQLGLELLSLPVDDPADLARAFESAARARVQALAVIDDLFITRHRAAIIDLAAQHRLPVIALYRAFVGALITYGADNAVLYRRAAQYVDRILRGAKPSDLPIEQPTKFDLVVNLKVARALGLEIPASLLARADEVIE